MEDVVLQTDWGTLVAIYLFLGGLAGGTLLTSAIIDLRAKDTFKRTVRFGAWAGTLCLIVGVMCLLLETTMPARAILMWKSFTHFGSWMTIGAWLLFCGIIVAGLYALASTEAVTKKLGFLAKWRRGLAVLAGVFGTCIALYTGILISVLAAHPLWNTALLPVLFTVSAFDTGVALVLLYLATREDKSVEALPKLRKRLETATIILVVLEFITLAVLLLTVKGSNAVGAASVALLTGGALAPWFWGLLVCVGLAVPLAVSVFTLAKHADKTGLAVLGSLCCLVGGCTLRFLVLLAGLPMTF